MVTKKSAICRIKNTQNAPCYLCIKLYNYWYIFLNKNRQAPSAMRAGLAESRRQCRFMLAQLLQPQQQNTIRQATRIQSQLLSKALHRQLFIVTSQKRFIVNGKGAAPLPPSRWGTAVDRPCAHPLP